MNCDLVVIGAGAAGLAAARTARSAGRSVALLDVARPGGDCTHYGCVPSKTMLDVAHRVAGARAAQQWGLPPVADVDFGQVMSHVRAVVADVERDESPQQLAGEGIDLVRGWARFTGPHSIDVDGRRLDASRFVLATGAHAAIPPVPGIGDVAHLTNGNLFELTERPAHLLVLGGGPIGVELAQAFAQLGSRVTLIEAAPRILVKEEPEVSSIIAAVLERNGVEVRTGAAVEQVSAGPALQLAGGGTVSGSHLLVAVGRSPAAAGMGLDRAGVVTGSRGEIVTDRYLRTSARHIFAAGDCTSLLQFTHVADEQGRLGCRQRVRLPTGGAWLAGRAESVRHPGGAVGDVHRPRSRAGRDERAAGVRRLRPAREGGGGQPGGDGPAPHRRSHRRLPQAHRRAAPPGPLSPAR